MTTRANRAVRPIRAEEGLPADVASFLSLLEAAEHLGVSTSFVRRLVYERRVTYYKLGRYLRFNPTDLDEYVLHSRVDIFPSAWASDHITGRRPLDSSSA
jgi:excisionase family DNA binding protein